MQFVTKKPLKTPRNTLKIAADFETVVVDNKHHVFAAGYKTIEEGSTPNTIYANSASLAIHGIEYESDRVIGVFMSALEKELADCPHNSAYVYFHNFNGFDSMFIIEWVGRNIPDRHKSVRFLDKNNKLYQLSINHGSIRFVDSLNIANSSLDKLGWDLLKQKKMEIDYAVVMGSPEACIKNKPIIVEYLIRDLELLAGIVGVIDATFRSMGLCITRNITASSLAYQLYTQEYYQNPWRVEKPRRAKYDFIEKAYYGGLVMMNKPTTKNARCYDVNSMYPSVMINNDMPLGVGKWVQNKSWSWIKKSNKLGFVDCTVIIKQPGLPYRRNVGSGLITPVGEVRGVYTTEELKFHETRGAIITRVFAALLYPYRGVIFKEFIERLHAMRCDAKTKGNDAMSLCVKLLMNGAYGKFGTRNEFSLKKYIRDATDDKIDRYEALFSRTVQFNKTTGLLCVHYNREELENSLHKIRKAATELGNNDDEVGDILSGTTGVYTNNSKGAQIAAFTTSYARIALLRGIDEGIKHNNASGNDCEVIYTDTDSIIINGVMPNNMLSNTELGYYKEEADISEAIFLGPKTYMLRLRGEGCTLDSTCKGCKRVFKGIPR